MTTGVYLGGFPSNKFAFPRSYAYQLSFLGDTVDYDQSGDTFTMWIDRGIGYGITYVLHPYILPWSSNRYTLDYVVYDCWWHAFGDGIHHPQGFTVNFWWRTTPEKPTLSIIQPLGGTLEKVVHLDGQPPGYWLPPTYT